MLQAWQAGPKIALHFPLLFVGLLVCAPSLITCTKIISHTTLAIWTAGLCSYYEYSSIVTSLIKIPKIRDNVDVRLTETRTQEMSSYS